MTRPYVYELIEKSTGRWYVGSRSGRGCDPSDLGVSYFTCSKLLEPLFRANPDGFEKRILLVGPADYVVDIESAVLKQRGAKDDPLSFNMWNGDGKFNPVKAATSTVVRGLGVHNRTPETRQRDAQKGGLLGGKVTRDRRKGIFARTLEQMQAAGRHCGLSQDIEIKRANGRKSGQRAKELGLGFCGMSKEQRRANGLKTQQVRVKCETCGMITTRGGLSIHQRATGHAGRSSYVQA